MHFHRPGWRRQCKLGRDLPSATTSLPDSSFRGAQAIRFEPASLCASLKGRPSWEEGRYEQVVETALVMKPTLLFQGLATAR